MPRCNFHELNYQGRCRLCYRRLEGPLPERPTGKLTAWQRREDSRDTRILVQALIDGYSQRAEYIEALEPLKDRAAIYAEFN